MKSENKKTIANHVAQELIDALFADMDRRLVEDANWSTGSMPFAYKPGNNPADKSAYYYCHECGIELHGEDVGYIAAGPQYADGEWARCPMCGEENSVYRGNIEE